MIALDLQYYRPASWEEAVNIYKSLADQGKNPVYYSGGTEVITTLREGSLVADAVIDLKGVPECRTLEFRGDSLVVGAAVTLNEVLDSGFFPLLGQIGRMFLDHTNRNKVTVGGNICSRLPYREMALPFLLTDSEVVLAGTQGVRRVGFPEVFDRVLRLNATEVLLQVSAPKAQIEMPWAFERRTRNAKIAYPLTSVAGLNDGGYVRLVLSGVCDFPFRSWALEQCMNDSSLPLSERLDRAMALLPADPRSDIDGSGEYRVILAKNLLARVARKLEVG